MSDHSNLPSTVRAWDPLLRVFHWSLVFFFLLAFITEDDWLELHVIAGYAVSCLIAFRLLWGLVGTRNARFTTFVKSPANMAKYIKSLLKFKVPHYLGHNPLGAAMVVALLSGITLVAFTGMTIIAIDGNGPLAGTFVASWNADWMEEVHEAFANFTLFMVIAHIAGVGFSSLVEGENLVKAMLTGRKKRRTHWEDVTTQPTKEG